MRHFLDLSTDQLKLLHEMISSRRLESSDVLELIKKIEIHLAIPGIKR
jgi:hypothetical protein